MVLCTSFLKLGLVIVNYLYYFAMDLSVDIHAPSRYLENVYGLDLGFESFWKCVFIYGLM